VGPEIETFLDPEMGNKQSECHLGPKKSRLKRIGTHGVHVRGFPSLAGLVGLVLKNILLPWVVYSVVNLVQDNISLATQATWRVSKSVSLYFFYGVLGCHAP
jgi:hypothetical protein